MMIRVFRIVYQTIEDFLTNPVVYWSYSVVTTGDGDETHTY